VKTSEVPAGVTLICWVVLIGSVLGGYSSLRALTVIFPPNTTSTIFQLLYYVFAVSVFALCFWLGLQLWNGGAAAVRRARWLFLAQVLIIKGPWLAYDFQLLGITPYISDGARLGITFGSSFWFLIAPKIDDVTVGVNLVALAATIYLFRLTAPPHRPASPGDSFGLA